MVQIKKTAVYGLIGTAFKGNVACFSRALGLSYTTVWRTLSGKSSGAARFVPALANYCKANNLTLMDYIDF